MISFKLYHYQSEISGILIKIVKLVLLYKRVKIKILITLSTANPPPPPVINRKHLETPFPSAYYVICERPLITLSLTFFSLFLENRAF